MTKKNNKNKEVKLTIRQKKFCDYYIETGNATEAARKAGYSEKTANRIATENLTKPVIKECLDSRLKELESKRVASITEVMEFYTRVLRGEEKDSFGLEVGVDSKIKAAENLSKRLGLIRTKDEEILRLKQLELEVKKKELEIEKLKVGESSETTKTMEAIKKLGEKIAGDFS